MRADEDTSTGMFCDVKSLGPVELGSRNEEKIECKGVFVVVPSSRYTG